MPTGKVLYCTPKIVEKLRKSRLARNALLSSGFNKPMKMAVAIVSSGSAARGGYAFP
jgi:hypothetical protein